jgi:HPr kinase/phosphorylase
LNSAGPEHIEADRLHGSRQLCEYLGVTVCEVSIPVAPGRNLAVLVEAAARSHILYTNGQDPTQEFILRQRDIMQNEG